MVVAVYASGSWRCWYCWQCKRGDRKVVVGECDGDEDRWQQCNKCGEEEMGIRKLGKIDKYKKQKQNKTIEAVIEA